VRIAEFSVKNRQFTVVAFVALLAMGIYSILSIPRAEDPSFPIPIYPIIVVYPGANPTDLEQLVVDPIEDRVRALEDLVSVKTSIEDGLAVILPEFDVSVDADRKYDEVVREVNALRAELPQDLARLDVNKVSPMDVNIAQFALVSETAPYAVLDQEARKLRDELARIAGVKESDTWGYPQREVRVAASGVRGEGDLLGVEVEEDLDVAGSIAYDERLPRGPPGAVGGLGGPQPQARRSFRRRRRDRRSLGLPRRRHRRSHDLLWRELLRSRASLAAAVGRARQQVHTLGGAPGGQDRLVGIERRADERVDAHHRETCAAELQLEARATLLATEAGAAVDPRALLARRVRVPMSLFSMSAMIALVPGTFAYRTMLALIALVSTPSPPASLATDALVLGTRTALVVGAIAVGVVSPSLFLDRSR